MKETLPFITATKRIKYVGINLPKETKDLYAEKYKTLSYPKLGRIIYSTVVELKYPKQIQIEKSKFLIDRNPFRTEDLITLI